MKKALIFLTLIFVFSVNSQNLVFNPSFESFDICPDEVSQIERCIGWQSFGGTPDYFNKCNNFSFINAELVGVPKNYFGFQNAAEGDSYCGLNVWPDEINREIIGSKLITPLEIGVTYYISYKLNFPYRDGNACANTAIKNFGIRFSNFEYSFLNPHPLDNYCDVCADEFIFDTLNWVEIKGSFVSNQNYEYIVLSNFYNDNNTEIMTIFPPTGCGSFSAILIDDIKVSTDSMFIDKMEIVDKPLVPNIFSPNSDGLNDMFKLLQQDTIKISDVTIFNRWGSVVFNSTDQDFFWDGKYLNKNCSEGVYFWKLNYFNTYNELETKSGLLQLIR